MLPEVFAVGLEVLVVEVVALCQLSTRFHRRRVPVYIFCTWKTGLLPRSSVATVMASSASFADVNDIGGTA